MRQNHAKQRHENRADQVKKIDIFGLKICEIIHLDDDRQCCGKYRQYRPQRPHRKLRRKAVAAAAAGLVPVPFEGAQVLLVPGLSIEGEVPEVMRGEEVQIVGALAQMGRDAVACLPGSHSKWARIAGGRIEGFTTHLTGEAFAALRDHTILGRLIQPGAVPDLDAFARGVGRSADPGGLLYHLFGVRTLGLFGRLADAESYLSGLLIGHEVRAAAPPGPVHLIGAPALCALYARAITQCGGSTVLVGEDAAAQGLAIIAEHAQWT